MTIIHGDDEDAPEFDQLADAREVEAVPTRGQGLRLAASLVIFGIAAGGIFAGGAVFVGGIAVTEAGLCRITWAPCTQLSLGSVEALSGLTFPEGTEVISGFSRESTRAPEFRAEVVLPEGAPFSLTTDYAELDEPRPDLIPAIDDSRLTGFRYWSPFEQVDGSTSVAVQGTDSAGRTVILFDTHPRSR